MFGLLKLINKKRLYNEYYPSRVVTGGETEHFSGKLEHFIGEAKHNVEQPTCQQIDVTHAIIKFSQFGACPNFRVRIK